VVVGAVSPPLYAAKAAVDSTKSGSESETGAEERG